MEEGMPSLPEHKVGIVACSGEEIAEGTVTRLAALKVLHELRRGKTVTICLPLFLAGGEGDRNFAQFHPTITVDGCKLACAAKLVKHSGATVVREVAVYDTYRRHKELKPEGIAELNPEGKKLARALAEELAELVDALAGAPSGGDHA